MVRSFLILLILLPEMITAQMLDFSAPEKLSKEVNSEFEESFPLISPDGKTLYFTRALYPGNKGGRFSGSDIWVSTYDEVKQTWTTPGNSNGVENNSGNNALVGMDAKGETIYFMSTNPDKRANGIYYARKSGNSWSRPELIPIEGLEPLGFLSFYVSPDFDVIFISMRGYDSRGEEDLYVSTKTSSGAWTKPKNLGSGINTAGFEMSPFLSSDKKRLYFSSNGHKGMGDADIFYCNRLYNSWDTWSTPRNLGEKINSENFDAYFSIYGDSVAYFSSNRGSKYSDIYKVGVVPGNEVLAFGQRYLTLEEIGRVLGNINVARIITFDKSEPALSGQQKELLFFIANKLVREDEVNVQLTVIEENDPALTQQRLNAISKHLQDSGVDNVRILLTNNERVKKKSTYQTTIEILLYK